MADTPAPRRNPSRLEGRASSPPAWVRRHLPLVAGVGVAVVAIVVIVLVLVFSASSGGGRSVPPGSIVGNGPLTTGYRLTGTVKARTATALTVLIARVDASGGEARNVVVRAGATVEFDKPTDGTAALARNGHEIASPSQLHIGDTVVLVGQFTNVVSGPGGTRQGYSYIGVEASS